jgi:hypothetical protein
LAAAPLAQAAKPKPRPAADLRATASKPSAAAAKPGDTITVKVTLRNAGRGRAGATKTRISLGAGRAFAAGDLVLASLRQRALAPRAKAKPVTAKLRIPLDGRAGGRRTLLACADGDAKVRERNEKDNCAVAGAITFPAVAADSLIAADLAAKRIDQEQAWALGVLARAASPDALPERYRGATGAGGAGTTALIAQAAARFATLAPKTQQLLAPLFAPPGHVPAPAKRTAGSKVRATAAALPAPNPDKCLARSRGLVPDTAEWGSIVAPRSKVTFWYAKANRSGRGIAQKFATAMDTVIWPKLTGLMDRTPRPDGAMDCGHGGSDGLDVYIVDMLGGRPWNAPVNPGDQGATTPYTCLKSVSNSSFMRIADGSVTTLAHEFTHVLQFASPDKTDCQRPDWMDEGLADFASEYAYPGTLQNTSSQWLEQFPTDLESRSYDAWPFWYSVALEGGPETIAAVYHGLETKSRMDAVDAGIGTLRKRWPEFARDAYNQEPVHSYTTWAVRTTTKPSIVGSLLATGGQSAKTVPYTGGAQLAPLTRDYDDYSFADDVRKITLAGLPISDDMKVHALLRMKGGDWVERDLGKDTTFCRDRPAEDVQEMVLIASNASPTARVTGDPKITVEDSCGLPRFRVLAAKFDTKVTGSTSSKWGQSCKAFDVSGTEVYGGRLAAPVNDPAFKLTKNLDGGLEGDVFFDVPADGTTHLVGCQEPPPDYKELSCEADKSIRKAQGSDTMGFEIAVEPHRPDEARMRWAIQEASIGYFDADDSVCNVSEFYNFVGPDEQVKTVPLEQLQHGTHTFTNSGTKTWDIDAKTKTPAKITLDWSYEITLQVLDKDGNPIP